MALDLLAHRDEVATRLATGPAGLFFDIDGTLSPLVDDPAVAIIPSGTREALARLSRTTHVVLLTGRSVQQARGIVGLDGVIYSGNHGTQWMRDGKEWVIPEAERFVEIVHDAALDAAVQLCDVQGLYIEDKGPSLSIHYRQASDRAAAAAAIESFVAASDEAKSLRRGDGKMVIELRPPLDVTKGTTVESIVWEAGLRSFGVFGDDLTDVDGFRAAHRLSEGSTIDGFSVGVFTDGTPDAVRDNADYSVAGTEAVEEFLVWLAEQRG